MTEPRPTRNQVKSSLLCPRCLRVSRAALTLYDFACNWYVCPIHGPIVTGEMLAFVFRVS